MTRTVDLTADEALIDEARAPAREKNTILNEQFRLWFEACTRARREPRRRSAALRTTRSGKRAPKPARR